MNGCASFFSFTRLALAMTFALGISSAQAVEALERCYAPTESAPCIEVGKGKKVAELPIYPQNMTVRRSGAVIASDALAGCYDFNFKRVSDIPGGAASGRCNTKQAPVRFVLRYRTSCPEGKSTCTYGARIQVVPETTIDGPHDFGEAFNLNLTLGMPIVLAKNVSSFSAKDACLYLAGQSGGGYAFDEATQTCQKKPEKICEEIGWTYNPALKTCLSYATLECASGCGDPLQACEGYTYSPPGKNCVCKGKAKYRDTRGAACSWVHVDFLANPLCAMDDPLNFEWVAAVPGSGEIDACCQKGKCSSPTNSRNQAMNASLDESAIEWASYNLSEAPAGALAQKFCTNHPTSKACAPLASGDGGTTGGATTGEGTGTGTATADGTGTGTGTGAGTSAGAGSATAAGSTTGTGTATSTGTGTTGGATTGGGEGDPVVLEPIPASGEVTNCSCSIPGTTPGDGGTLQCQNSLINDGAGTIRDYGVVTCRAGSYVTIGGASVLCYEYSQTMAACAYSGPITVTDPSTYVLRTKACYCKGPAIDDLRCVVGIDERVGTVVKRTFDETHYCRRGSTISIYGANTSCSAANTEEWMNCVNGETPTPIGGSGSSTGTGAMTLDCNCYTGMSGVCGAVQDTGSGCDIGTYQCDKASMICTTGAGVIRPYCENGMASTIITAPVCSGGGTGGGSGGGSGSAANPLESTL